MKVLETPAPKVTQTANVKKKEPQARVLPQATQHQEAAAIEAVEDTPPSTKQKEVSLWPWYIGAAFLGAFALLGLRLTRDRKPKTSEATTAEDFEIIEEEDTEEPH